MPINYQKTYDTPSYEEGIEFRDMAIEVIQEIYPHYSVRPVEPQNPAAIYITNQDDNVRIQFPLRELYTRFSQTRIENIPGEHLESFVQFPFGEGVVTSLSSNN